MYHFFILIFLYILLFLIFFIWVTYLTRKDKQVKTKSYYKPTNMQLSYLAYILYNRINNDKEFIPFYKWSEYNNKESCLYRNAVYEILRKWEEDFKDENI